MKSSRRISKKNKQTVGRPRVAAEVKGTWVLLRLFLPETPRPKLEIKLTKYKSN